MKKGREGISDDAGAGGGGESKMIYKEGCGNLGLWA